MGKKRFLIPGFSESVRTLDDGEVNVSVSPDGAVATVSVSPQGQPFKRVLNFIDETNIRALKKVVDNAIFYMENPDIKN